MTDKPTTLSLDSAEWRAMLGHNLNRAVEFVQSSAVVTAENVALFHQHLDRMKALATAWHLSAPPAPVEKPQAAAVPRPASTAHAAGNGAVKKGGWPKGKSRKQRLAPGIAQQGMS